MGCAKYRTPLRLARERAEIDFYLKVSDLEGRMDCRTDKRFQRLANLKAFKAFEAAKSPEQLTASPPVAPALDSDELQAQGGDLDKVEGNPPVDSQPKESTQ